MKYRPYPYMDGTGERILSICKYVQSVMALTHIETEKYHKISEVYIVNEAKAIGQIHTQLLLLK